MSACVLAGGKLLLLAGSLFTLEWTHTVEKTRWRETWRADAAGLRVIEARVKGSGAGMEPGDGAGLVKGWWVWQPTLGPQPSVTLANSGVPGSVWRLCRGWRCTVLSGEGPLTLTTDCRT